MDVAAFLPAEAFKPLPKCCEPLLPYGAASRAMHQHADPSHPLGLLRPRRERPRGRAAEQRDELAAFHSITSSARPSSVIGKVRPSALAVLRLIQNPTLACCWIGRSPGLAPLRIFPVYTPTCRYASAR